MAQRRADRRVSATEPSPVSLAMLFDISGSMRRRRSHARCAICGPTRALVVGAGRDEAALFTFDSRLHEVAPFTVDTRALQGALGEVDPFGATSLYDAIAEAAQTRRRPHRPAPRRRRAHRRPRHRERPDAGQVSGIASAIDVPVYVIAIVLPIDRPVDGPGHRRQASLQAEPIGTVEDLAPGRAARSSTRARRPKRASRPDSARGAAAAVPVRVRVGGRLGLAAARDSDA